MSERRCNECTLCCKLIPVAEIGKQAGTRCKFQRAKGCSIYRGRYFPQSCAAWSCAWLVNDAGSMHGMPRPDRARYVIDSVPDYVEGVDGDGERWRIGVVQIWIDPAHPDAHRSTSLRDWIERQAQHTRRAALIRLNSVDAFLLLPPCMSPDGRWHEKPGTSTGDEHALADIAHTLRVLDRGR